ncbi:MAG: RidA family protein, partial [Acidimicrobiia bacterium]|nr:RidA family protein [Acidimicrobiia bacterium]
MRIEEKIATGGFEIPVLPVKPETRRVRGVRTGNLIYTAGHGPYKDGGYPFKGPVGVNISVEAAREATKYNALALLSTVKSMIGDLDLVEQIVKLNAYIYGPAGFNQPSVVAEGCSDLLIDLYGERGRHARSAVSVASLTLDIC